MKDIQVNVQSSFLQVLPHFTEKILERLYTKIEQFSKKFEDTEVLISEYTKSRDRHGKLFLIQIVSWYDNVVIRLIVRVNDNEQVEITRRTKSFTKALEEQGIGNDETPLIRLWDYEIISAYYNSNYNEIFERKVKELFQ